MSDTTISLAPFEDTEIDIKSPSLSVLLVVVTLIYFVVLSILYPSAVNDAAFWYAIVPPVTFVSEVDDEPVVGTVYSNSVVVALGVSSSFSPLE